MGASLFSPSTMARQSLENSTCSRTAGNDWQLSPGQHSSVLRLTIKRASRAAHLSSLQSQDHCLSDWAQLSALAVGNHAASLTLPVSTSSSRCLIVSSWLGLRVRFLNMLISASQSGGAGSPSAWGLSILPRLLLRPLHTGIERQVWHGCCLAMEHFGAPWTDPALGLIVKGMSCTRCLLPSLGTIPLAV